MRKVISASRRTDLVAFFPDWLSSVLHEEKAVVYGPNKRVYTVSLDPDRVHSVVLWSKNFSNLLGDRSGLKTRLQKYDHVVCHFTITGLGGTFIEKGAPRPSEAFQQLSALIELAGDPGRIFVRFDPVVYWKEAGQVHSNLSFFEELAEQCRLNRIRDVRFSFAQWYNKAQRRADRAGFPYFEPFTEKKKKDAELLVEIAKKKNLRLYSCSQAFLENIAGIKPSSCIDGEHLQELHPGRLEASRKKDRSQRKDCRCTESVDIGSYTRTCPHSCLYCYANPQM